MALNANKVGLALGTLFALIHIIWAIIIRLGFGDNIMGGLMRLHFVGFPAAVMPFKIGTAIFLVVVAFIAGYVAGWLFAFIWNYYDKKLCK